MDKMLPFQQGRSGRTESTLVASLCYHCTARHVVLAYSGVKESYPCDAGLIASGQRLCYDMSAYLRVMVMPDDQSCDQLQQCEINNRFLLQNSRFSL